MEEKCEEDRWMVGRFDTPKREHEKMPLVRRKDTLVTPFDMAMSQTRTDTDRQTDIQTVNELIQMNRQKVISILQ